MSAIHPSSSLHAASRASDRIDPSESAKSVARIATLVALGALALLVNFLLLPFEIGFVLTLIECAFLSICCCPSGESAESNFSSSSSSYYQPIIDSPPPLYVPPVSMNPVPRRIYEPFSRLDAQINIDFRRHERVGDGPINRGPLAQRMRQDREPVGGGHVHISPLPPTNIAVHEPVGGGHRPAIAPISSPSFEIANPAPSREPVGHRK